jgi:predicted NodU family carbamoyl transferase
MLTLGHHASAVWFNEEDGIPLGYEEERLNRIKSTSAYPRLSLDRIEELVQIKKGSRVFVSHWFDDLGFHRESNKYFDKEHFDSLVLKYDLKPVFLNESFSHHDAHAWSGVSFWRNHLSQDQIDMIEDGEKVHVIVADGYGTNQEVISVYEMSGDVDTAQLNLVKRYYGYMHSLGLMYQYATSFVGMKENQDEYKFLGYETHVRTVIDEDSVQLIKRLANERASAMWQMMSVKPDFRGDNWRNPNGLVNFAHLANTKEAWHSIFGDVVSRLGFKRDERASRIVIGHYVQELIENVMARVLEENQVRHVILAGGIFYNVKLNNRILKNTTGCFCVVPVAGDQGCGVGMYEAYFGGFNWLDLKWGERNSFENWEAELSEEDLDKYGDNIRYYNFDEEEHAVEDTIVSLRENKLVNVVKAYMEYGPRALCSTTTLAMPTNRNVEIINDLNERDTVMPMAPVILLEEGANLFDSNSIRRVVGSDKFMILTYDYKNPNLEKFGGVAHKYPDCEVYSGRPQFIDETDGFMFAVLKGVQEHTPALINTSFNAHGRPIVYNFDSVFDSFKFEFDKAVELGHETPLLFLCDFDG